MIRSRTPVRTIVGLTVTLALCFALSGVQPAYAGDVTVQDALDTSLTIINNSFEGWLSAGAHDGIDMAQNVDIGDGGIAYFSINVTGPGTLSWWLRTDTEAGWDYFRLKDNGVEQPAYTRSGQNAWEQYSYAVPAGSHQIRFEYEKDASVSVGMDSVYLDELVYTANTPPVGRVDGAHLAGNEVKLLHQSPAASDLFGSAIAIGSNVLAVGALCDDTGFTDAGSVSIYRRVNGVWQSSQLLTASDEAQDANFGKALSLGNGRLAVGADDKIYVYLDNGTTFAPYGSPITCPDGPGYAFGQSLDIDGNMLVAGARSYNGERGRVYYFQYSSGAWNYVQHLDAPDAALSDFFGESVAVEDDRLVVGAPDHDHPGAPGGAVYVFDIDSGTFSFTAEYNDPNAVADDMLGRSVDVSGNTIVAGSCNPNVATTIPRVVVWVAGRLTDVLKHEAPYTQCWYGLGVAIDGDTILVPDEWYEGHPHGGTVFAYQRSNGEFFDLVEKLQMSVDGSFDGFGRSAAVSGAQMAVGAGVWDGSAGGSQGAAFVYDGSYYRVTDGGTLIVPAEKGVLQNDIDVDGDPLWVDWDYYSSPLTGSMSLHDPGNFEFTAAVGSPAEVWWQYGVTDEINQPAGPVNAYITVAPKPTGTPLINNGSHNSNVRDIPVSLAPVSNVRMYRTKVGTAPWSEWTWRAGNDLTVQLPAAAGTYTIAVDVKGSGGTASHVWSVTYPATYTQFPGSDRYQTAILAAQSAYPAGSCDEVIIATGANYPDALSAAGLGGIAQAPVLLVNPAKTRSDVIAEIKRLTQGRASFKLYIMGGTTAVPLATENWLKSSLTGETIVRFAGTDRYHTARLVAAYMKQQMGASMSTKALLVPGLDYTDGLIVGPAAFAQGAPILLVGPTADQPLIDTLKALGTTDLAVCGSAARIPVGTESTLKGSVPGLATHRVTSAADAYVRSAEAAEFFCAPANGFGLSWSGVGIATGERYPDGLAAGCVEGRSRTPLLLTRVSAVPASVNARLVAHKATITAVRFYGGDAAVSPAVRTTVANALK